MLKCKSILNGSTQLIELFIMKDMKCWEMEQCFSEANSAMSNVETRIKSKTVKIGK